ncbi:MAG: ATP-binding protein [Candidatus Dadabacteria bacterium]|nr:ATP-binding protein [Candidatus Dadabacteria bacterium]
MNSNFEKVSDEEILDRVNDSEDNFIERKHAGVKKAEIRRTLVAFANSVPEELYAFLFIGIKNDGEVQGVPNPDKVQKTVREIADECYPKLEYFIRVLNISNVKVVAVGVKSSSNRPHFSGPAFVRIGSESVEASDKIYEELIASRNSKCGEILRHKGETVTVVARKILGNPKTLGIPRIFETHECRIESCDAHILHLYELSTGNHYSEPIDIVTINRDNEMRRMMIEIG